MAKATDIKMIIRQTAEFLKDSSRPNSLGLKVVNLTTLQRSKTLVSFSRKELRSFAKTILTFRSVQRDTLCQDGTTFQSEPLYILKDVNIKSLKDSELGELFSATTLKGNGENLSKYYRTVVKMVYKGILSTALAEEEKESKTPRKPKVSNTQKKPKVSKAKKSTKKPKVSKFDIIFDEEGTLKPNIPAKTPAKKHTSSKTPAKKPKASNLINIVETTKLTFRNASVKVNTKEWENSNLGYWQDKASLLEINTSGLSKKQVAITVTMFQNMTN